MEKKLLMYLTILCLILNIAGAYEYFDGSSGTGVRTEVQFLGILNDELIQKYVQMAPSVHKTDYNEYFPKGKLTKEDNYYIGKALNEYEVKANECYSIGIIRVRANWDGWRAIPEESQTTIVFVKITSTSKNGDIKYSSWCLGEGVDYYQ